MNKWNYSCLSKVVASELLILVGMGVASAQAPAHPTYQALTTNQIALPVDPGQSNATLHISVAPPDTLTAPHGVASQITVSSAGFDGLHPFGKAPVTFEAQVGFDPSTNPLGSSALNPIDANEAWKALVGYQWGPVNFKAGLNQFYTNFATPLTQDKFYGVQETLGGTELDSSVAISRSFIVTAGGQFYDGRSNAGQQGLLGVNDHLNQANVGMSYGISSKSSIALGYEWVQWDLNSGQGLTNSAGKPTEQYITVGLGQDVSKGAAFKLLYQIVDYKDAGTGFTASNLPNNEGGTVIGQATIKF